LGALVFFAILIAYFAIFVVVGLLFGRRYFKGTPNAKNESEMSEFDRQEQISQTLAGFSIAGLTLLISLYASQLGKIEPLLTFFSIGLMLEIFSAFVSHYRLNRGFKYFGFVLQYTGLLATILGFADYFETMMPYSAALNFVYWLFVVGFFAVTLPELYYYHKIWKQ
jgi:p-aminobenzoyl-glutamate transporter AbgT